MRTGASTISATDPAPAFDARYRFLWPGEYVKRRSGRIAQILRAEQPDLVEICDKYSLFYLAAMLRKGLIPGVRRPVLVGLSCERMDDNVAAYLSAGRAARSFAQWYIRQIYGPPFDCHVANSEYTAQELRDSLRDRAREFIRVCPMGVDATGFGRTHRDGELRRHLLARAGGDESSVLLFYAGRLSPEKNVLLLVEMLEALSHRQGRFGGCDYRLAIAGEGPMAQTLLASAARRVPGRLLLLGALRSSGELARHYASADVFVHPNAREPFGIAPLEAMASGVPVVLPNAGGVLAYATHGNAWLADPTPDGLADAVWSVTARPDAGRLRVARETAREHHWSRVADQWFALYDTLIRQHHAIAGLKSRAA